MRQFVPLAALAAFAACSGAETPPPADPFAAYTGAEGQCAQAACTASTGSEASLSACVAERCAHRPATFGVRLDSVRFVPDTQTLFVQARLEHQDEAWGSVVVPRAEPVHVGVTAVTPEGREIDLLVQTLFPGSLDTPVMFSAELDGPAEVVLIGAWDRKIEPCEVDRHGCKAFGFVLDGSLATWPPGLYDRGVRQRIPPGSVSIALPGGREAWRAGDADPIAVLDGGAPGTGLLAPFGSALALQADGERPAGSPQVAHRHALDRYLAEGLATSLGSKDVVHDPALATDLAVRAPR